MELERAPIRVRSLNHPQLFSVKPEGKGETLRCFIAIIVAATAVGVSIVAPVSASTKGEPTKFVHVNNCPDPGKQKEYKGNIIVYVGGTACVSVSDGATVIARGDAVVAAHGNAAVVAYGRTTLIVFNESVTCSIKSRGVLVQSAIKDAYSRRFARCAPARI